MTLDADLAAHGLGQPLQIARPSPVPPYFRVEWPPSTCEKRWNSRPTRSDGMPGPWSVTEKARRPEAAVEISRDLDAAVR
jgi:hypothetical protein